MPDESIWWEAKEGPADGIEKTPIEVPLGEEGVLEGDPNAQEDAPAAVVPTGDACFPIDSQGMPKALKSIPARERPWFWKNMRYRGFFIAHVGIQDPRHEHLFEQEKDRAFYVKNLKGTVGLVPYPNATVCWPHERAWTQDLAPENQGKVRVDLKPSEQKKRKS